VNANDAVAALGALAQDTRLAIFRALVQAGPAGLAAGAIAERLDLPPPTLSFHLAQLKHAGLVSFRRESRSLIYAAEYGTMTALLAFLTENCCSATKTSPASCRTSCEPARPAPKRRTKR
jgi:DNA-binding transcriptional ArsR family regulator